MSALLLILLITAGILEVAEAVHSAPFVKVEIPAGNHVILNKQEAVASAMICSMKCLHNNVFGIGTECSVFSFNETTQTCAMGIFSVLDKSDEENTTIVVWKQKGCDYPPDPENGRFSCIKNIKQEKCFLICNPGYVAQSFRGLYCNQTKWNKPLEEFQCLPTVMAIVGGNYEPKWGEFSLFGPNGQVLIKEGGVTFREHVTEYFSGETVSCGGGWGTPRDCYAYNFATGWRKLQARLKAVRIGSGSAIVQDRYYIIGGITPESILQAEYLQEGDETVTQSGMFTPQLNDLSVHVEHYCCAVRFTDRSFIHILNRSVSEYDIITGVYTKRPELNVPRLFFGCDSFLDEDDEVVFIVAGGNNENATKSAEIFKPSVGHWTMIGNLTYPRLSNAVVTTSDGVFVIGGQTNPSGKVEKLDMKTMTWIDTGLVFSSLHAFKLGATAIPANLLPPWRN
ncbi:uncharacterized protein LOC111696161 [Eurytemora carolleeae]|uniref:uncharacterized protein LOC111696161 n=1 Tax=Eurytemora carolleeae TaxID=1294199 RepID=UPI000C77B3CB|nr:uncharacterized protein LOC111696161 [Eurytemora carolleeae]|eukprot:XP_023321477.1 uncharacterized protein LOC111696161 [Eurytemora affinis]